MKIMQEGTRAVAILMMDEAAQTIGTTIMQYVEKHLNPLLNKVDTVTMVLEEMSSTVKIITENAKQMVDETNTQ